MKTNNNTLGNKNHLYLKIKNSLFLIVLLFSMGSFGQSVMASGNAYLVRNNDFENAKKSDNYLVFTIQKKEMFINVNGNISKYNILYSNITGGGRTRKYTLRDNDNVEMAITISLMSKVDVIVFPWDPSTGIMGFIKIKLTPDDKRILGYTNRLNN